MTCLLTNTARLQVLLEQRRGAGVESAHLLALLPRVMELSPHVLRQHLAQLHAPLVERAHAPDEALRRRAVLVDRQQLPARVRRQLREQKRRRWSVALEQLVRAQSLRHALRLQVGHALAAGQRVRLREEVAHQLVVIAHHLARALQRHLALAEADEVARHHTALVDQLIEAVLPVRARLAEVHLARGEGQWRAVHRHALAVRLHVHLLDVRCEANKWLGVRQQGTAGVLEEGGVPHAQQTQHGGNVL